MNDQEFRENAVAWRRMRHLHRYLRREKDDRPPNGLGEVSAAILALLWEANDAGELFNQKQIAAKVHSPEESVSKILDNLRTSGYCEVIFHPSSARRQRGKFHRITEAGKSAVNKWIEWEYAPTYLIPEEDTPERTKKLIEALKPTLRQMICGS